MTPDEAQLAAIRHRDGPAMILAGPGSGKTTVLTERLYSMIFEAHFDPSFILVITFSRAAAREMQERFLLRTDRQRVPVNFGTFHAVFFHILQTAYGYSAGQIARERDKARFVREYIRRLRLETAEEDDLVAALLSAISRSKNGGAKTDFGDTLPCEETVFWTIRDAYQEFLGQNGLLDFDDMLVMTRDLFAARPEVLTLWQRRFRHILIDEFQDINPLQYEIVRMLALPENNLFIVGDDDQSIYGFRGASPQLMLRFPKDYPDAARILLATNYRSGASIVSMAGGLIAHNEHRFIKEIHTAQAGDQKPVVRYFPKQIEQHRFVAEEILRLEGEVGVPFSEMAILFRTNEEMRLLSAQLQTHNIPFFSRNHLPLLYDHWIAQDVCAYLRLSMGERTRSHLLRIMNRPNRDLSRESLPCETVSFAVWAQYYAVSKRGAAQAAAIRSLEADLRLLSTLHPFAALTYLRKAIGYEGYLLEHARTHHMPVEDLLAVFEQLTEDAKAFASVEEWFAHQEDARQRQAEAKSPREAVTLSTYHAAKGLEYDTVFLIDLCENVIPYWRAVDAGDVEEERRLFYVGLTRARRRLYLLSPAQIRNKEMAPSRFLTECDG